MSSRRQGPEAQAGGRKWGDQRRGTGDAIPRCLQRILMRRAGALPILEILLCRLDVSPKVAVLLSLLDILHLMELRLFPELDIVIIVLSTNTA